MTQVTFQKTAEVKKGKSLLQIAKKENIKIKSPCKGKGKCGKCLVKIISGTANPPTKNEIKGLSEKKLKEGYRYACEITEMEDLVVEWEKDK
ncbi:2Fe-2S iron-sulfur cluster-binding protein [Fusibacter sp. JL216-2]|uniref:2Fe-2S iron-sulfur cluster-binding protein n=1 Tax=Fusibacter sp. JL216-2 TaxID=3071453 RepID=UPI003D32C52B